MNDKKICFIICSNDSFATSECLLYINNLHIPEGYEIDVLTVEEADSMTSGYNEAMASTDAKYKVYLHQDVYITNKRFLSDILNIFTNHKDVGMIGIVGNTSIAENGAPWSDGQWRRIGKLYIDVIKDKAYSLWGDAIKPYQEVVVVDGLLMATQYDLPWREDLFGGWDFYDCSQSLEFIRKGYKVVIPYMDKPWCLHDNDKLHMQNYEKWRQVFEKEYKSDYMNWNVLKGKVK